MSTPVSRAVEEGVPDLLHPRIVVVEEPRRRRVRVHLPRRDRVLLHERVHRVESRVDVADRGQRLTVHEHAPVAAQSVGEASRVVHPRGRQWTVVVGRGDRTDDAAVGVGSKEDLVEVIIDGEARARIGFAAGCLREAAPEVPGRSGQVVLEEVGLEIEDELVAAERVLRRFGRDGRVLRNVQPAAGLPTGARDVLVARAGLHRDEHRRRRHGRQEKVPA